MEVQGQFYHVASRDGIWIVGLKAGAFILNYLASPSIMNSEMIFLGFELSGHALINVRYVIRLIC